MSQSAAEILQALHDKYPAQVTDAMMQSDPLRRVVQAYIDDPDIDARHAAHHLTYFLQSFRYMAPLIYKEIRAPYSIDQAAAVDEIRGAASHLSSSNPNYTEVVSGNRDQLEQLRQQDPGIMDLSRPENVQKLAEKDLLSHALESIADAVESLSEEQVTPQVGSMELMQTLDIDGSNLKTRGRAHSPDTALNGLLVREINHRIPSSISKNRAALIADLAALVNIEIDVNSIGVILSREK